MMKKLSVLLLTVLLVAIGTQAYANLIVNGDFESGDTDFSSDYTPGNLYPAAYYVITTDPSLDHTGATSYGDHTTGSGNMMAVNASTMPSDRVWYQTVPVAQNTWYDFSAWVSSWTGANLADLSFKVDINLIDIGTFMAPGTTGVWDEFSASFNSGSNNSVTIAIRDLTGLASGDDFAIDDISLTAVPEPATMLLVGFGLIGLAGARRKIS